MERKCDSDCNNCKVINDKNSVILAQIFQQIEYEMDEEITHIVNKFCPNLTVCPTCKIDDFLHMEGCEFAK